MCRYVMRMLRTDTFSPSCSLIFVFFDYLYLFSLLFSFPFFFPFRFRRSRIPIPSLRAHHSCFLNLCSGCLLSEQRGGWE